MFQITQNLTLNYYNNRVPIYLLDFQINSIRFSAFSVVHVCQIYAVKCFYDDLLNCPLPISQTLCSQRSNTSATATLTPEDCVNVSVNNPTTTVPDRVCQFQNERHPVGQQQYPNVHPTSICSPQHYKPAVAPEQQLHHHCLQEYCNPPAYWPEIYSNRCLENDHQWLITQYKDLLCLLKTNYNKLTRVIQLCSVVKL